MLTGIFVFFGCQTPLEEPLKNPEFSVTGMLLSDSLSSEQQIYVFNTSDFEDKIWWDNYYAGANVFLTDSVSFSTEFPVVRDSVLQCPYYTNLIKTIFLPERTYFLIVKTVGGVITGQTKMPGDFNITYPENDDTISVPENTAKDVEFRWTESKGSYGYIIRTEGIRIVEYNGTIYTYKEGLGTYLTNEISKVFTFSKFPRLERVISEEYTINIIAFDKNYYDHHFNMNNSAGLKGGYGYFSSGVIKKIKIIIK